MTDLISIIIVTYNNHKSIRKCLNSIKKFIKQNHEIIIVNNASIDSTKDEIKKSQVKVLLLDQSKNLGFSKANNLAYSKSKGNYIFILNPDTEIRDKNFTKMLDYLKQNKNIGIIAPKLIDDINKPQPSVRKEPTLTGALREYFFNIKNSYNPYVPDLPYPQNVESVVAAAMLFPREVYKTLKGFNEKFFLYFEDLDICKRVRDLGYKIVYYPKFLVGHSIGLSSKTNPLTAKLFESSAKLYYGSIKYWLLHYILRIHQIIS